MAHLIRDRAQEYLEKFDLRVSFRKAPQAQRKNLLFGKLMEESAEWLGASSREQRIKELGDLQELLWALGEMDSISREEILAAALDKHQARGGYQDLVLMEVETDPKPDPKSQAQQMMERAQQTPSPLQQAVSKPRAASASSGGSADYSYGMGDGPYYSG